MFHVKHSNVGKTVCIANQKGGVGKTTTSINLAASLAALEHRVLLIDIDPQGNSTTGLNIEKADVTAGSYDLLTNNASLQEVIVKTEFDNLFIVPATMDLAGAEVELVSANNREQVMQNAFHQYEGEVYDFVLIDCPPALNLLTLNALTASDRVMITLQTEFYAMEGLSQLIDTIRRIRQSLNKELSIDGIVLTMVDRRNNLAQQVEDEVREYFGEQVYEQIIPRNVRLSEAPSFGIPVLYHDMKSAGAQAYLQLAQEFLQREGESING
ncbi:MAG: chromosome partitioning protein ParA [Zetaproteobacteria bacterium CG_4_9_14_3_um_filter_49_83]|nr:MAG: chromosome partitioning protein ParA [Zetaproteobacteria bacterium CG17_big_fil_post_rev_8_21_14_2_50_50_13]PIV31029.1 MAG: chromosome partitioning protein ParA [Zetaproteobacteria bacterium CG02_land_8_20_14_3_00_50_9]PIY55212.1 MAG: chromosome partitioning protein ParA [Zetaproteobacteria bacterium CG_4_10_14_0_8_um_filter_49_80]PJA36224.1 MAG: chromosome partitioning protein ParA [Zetaproteobacteria bacterium CG_4_9_14_3_um_filter_49_83]